MQRILTGVAAVALALGVWACGDKKGVVNTNNEAQVASVQNASTKTSLADSVQPSATPAESAANSASATAEGAEELAEAQVSSGRDYYRLLYTQWSLRKSDGTELLLAFRSPDEVRLSATYREAGELVSVIQRCPVTPLGSWEFKLTCGAPEYHGTYKGPHKYRSDTLLVSYLGSDEIRVFETPEGQPGERIPVEVVGRYPYDPPLPGAVRAR